MTKHIDFTCNSCGCIASKLINAYKKYKKDTGLELCQSCSRNRASLEISKRTAERYAKLVKNTDIVDVQCQCGLKDRIQYRAAKRGYKCLSCVTRENRVTYKEKYDLASKSRVNNDAFAALVSNGLAKYGKEHFQESGRKAALALWQNADRRSRELERRKTIEYKEIMSGKPTNLISNDEYIYRASEIHAGRYDYSITVYKHSKKLIDIICPIHGVFSQTASDHLYHGNGCPQCAKNIIISKPHKQVIEYLEQFDSSIIINDREALDGLEIDIYSKKHGFGIEMHGIFWHSYGSKETRKEIERHKIKAELAQARNIRLFQIYENEWKTKNEIIKSMISHVFHKSERKYARACEVIEVSKTAARDFFNTNHLQGDRNALLNLALELDGLIVAMASFSRHAKYDYELIRSAALKGYCVVGGLSKLLSAAQKRLGMHSLMTYADRRFSFANSYLRVGFNLIDITKPGYYYVKGNNVYSRQKFQKHKLPKILDIYDGDLSESENMFNNGYRRLWDAGHIKLLKVFDKNEIIKVVSRSYS